MSEAKYKKVHQGSDDDVKVTFHKSTDTKERKKILIICLLTLLVLAIIIAIIVLVLLAKRGSSMAVASDNDVCTQIGANMLERGGSGVDATIAILLCLGAVQPQSNGIGGGGFMLVHSLGKNGSMAINFREKAPAASTQTMYVDDPKLAVTGGMAVGVPGEIRGYKAAHVRYGKLQWAELFKPSIKILREGIVVTAHMENAIDYTNKDLKADDNCKKIFFKEDGSKLKKGDTFTNTKLADAYESISKDADAFYTGTIAANIVKATSARKGIMTLKDLKDYQPLIVKPLEFEYRGKKALTVPPPASGHVVSLVLQLLDNFELSLNDTMSWNYILEAFRHGYAARSRTGDIDFSDQTKWVVGKISNGTWVQDLLQAGQFDKNSEGFITPHSIVNEYGKVFATYDGTHTTHVSVLGPEGEAVSCTSTVNLYFGSRVMTDDGIILNNEMDDFSTPGHTNSFGFPPSPENFIVPGKRPMSSSSPTIVLGDDGKAKFVTGAAGGSRIITGSLLSTINAMDYKLSLKDSLDAKRIHDQLTGETLYEDGVDASLIAGLNGVGYNMTLRPTYMSVVTSVSDLGDETEASGDPRKKGTGKVI